MRGDDVGKPEKVRRPLKNRLLFVAKDMRLAELRCAVWQVGGYEASSATFRNAVAMCESTFDVVVLSYHLDNQQRQALKSRFLTARFVDLQRNVTGDGLIEAVS